MKNRWIVLTIVISSIVLLLAFSLLVMTSLKGGEKTLFINAEIKEIHWILKQRPDFQTGSLQGLDMAGTDPVTLSLAAGYQDGALEIEAPKSGLTFNALSWDWQAVQPAGTAISLTVQVSMDGKQWSEWRQLPLIRNELVMDDAYSQLAIVGPARYARLRLTMHSQELGLSPKVNMLKLSFIDTSNGPDTEAASALAAAGKPRVGGIAQPPIISRSAWGANERYATWKPEYVKPRLFIIHHTAIAVQNNDSAASVRAIYYFHAVTRNWGDIGYNYLIDKDGNIFEGRKGGPGVVGGHAYDFNYGSIGIAMMGDYSSTRVPTKMRQSLDALIAWLGDTYGIDPRQKVTFNGLTLPTIVGHRDVGKTACPGDAGYSQIPLVREDVWDIFNHSAPRLETSVPLQFDKFVTGKVTLQAGSTSPDLKKLQISIDDKVKAETGDESLKWQWKTSDYKDGTHTLKISAANNSGKKTSMTAKVTVDNTPPTGTLTMNNGQPFTNQPTVTLRLKATDNGVGVDKMLIYAGKLGGENKPYREVLTTTLTGEDGVKTAGVRFIDRLKLTSDFISSTIVLDTHPPAWAEPAAPFTNSMRITVSDGLSGLSKAQAAYSTGADDKHWGAWQPMTLTTEGAYSTTLAVNELRGAGYIRFRAADRAGNIGISAGYPFNQAEAAPVSTITPTVTVPATGTLVITGTPAVTGTVTITGTPAATTTLSLSPTVTVTPQGTKVPPAPAAAPTSTITISSTPTSPNAIPGEMPFGENDGLSDPLQILEEWLQRLADMLQGVISSFE